MNDIDKSVVPVWRYMSFSKFAWTIQNNCLWLSRADLLGDPWEISLSGNQMELVINRHPIAPIGALPRESAIERSSRIINSWRKSTFINCWNKSPQESYALWSIYCNNVDGVVIQTTLAKLNLIASQYSLHEVTYPLAGSNLKTPSHTDLVTKKRPMFSYEEELRIVYFDEENKNCNTEGVPLKFNFEQHIESVRVHPKSDSSFFNTVQNIVKTYSPGYVGKVLWSEMRLGPPF